jgi:DNA-binding CsgD family transcriptional regulator
VALAGLLGRRTECALLDELVETVRAGQSRALVVRGDPGIGKSALLQQLVESTSDFRVLRAVGIEPEMELAFAGLHQLCAPLLDGVVSLPDPQRNALETVFGRRAGSPPDRFLVGLAVMGLLCDAADRRPVACIVDDVQWLDRASAQALAFVARRLLADPVLMVFSTREDGQASGEFAALPELVLEGLSDADARALLTSVPDAPLDEQVRERVLRETYGNPLALLEWHRSLAPGEPVGRFGSPAAGTLPRRIEEGFRRRLVELPSATRQFLLVAAAEAVGDPVVVWRAARSMGVEDDDDAPAVEAGLVQVEASVRFRHPLVRSAAYESASLDDRQRAHRALAAAIDPQVEPDRHAWHRARAAVGPDEDVAVQLERSAGRAQARGGLAAAAAFLERAADLTADPARRAERALAAARAKHQAGAPDAAHRLLGVAQAGPLDALGRARVDLLLAQIAHSQNRRSDAPGLLLRAADRLETLHVGLARDTYLDALWAAQFAGRLARGGQLLEVAQAALAAPRLAEPRACDLLLEGSAIALVDGYAAGVPVLQDAVAAFCRDDIPQEEALRWWTFAGVVAQYLWDHESADRLSARHIQLGRETGAVGVLSVAMGLRIVVLALAGELHAAAQLVDEARTFAEAIGTTLQPYGPLMVAAWRGREAEVTALVDATLGEATARGEDEAVAAAQHARAVVGNGAGRYEEALVAALASVPPQADGQTISNFALVELVEAAARTGQVERGAAALRSLAEITSASGSDWALGVEARSRALLSATDGAEDLYREAIERLGRTRVRGESARAHLVYGEWLRRQNRRVDARGQLRTAHEMFTGMGIEHFAERARRELAATGETVRARTVETITELTPQEAQIARLARDGRTNPEIGAELFLSARTVEWHLRKVFTKLGVTSRKELRGVLSNAAHGRVAAER